MPKKTAKKATSKSATEKSVKTAKTRGGKRPGAGRPKGSGKYGCATKAVRIPAHLIAEVDAFIQKKVKAAGK